MSGEKSKSSGEYGEKLADAFLAAIGWKQGLKSLAIPCMLNKHVGSGGEPRTSHGDDVVFVYNNPFYDSRTDVIHVSVKNNIGGYDSREHKLRSSLKGYVSEANEIIECAQYDAQLLQILASFSARKRKEHSGLLIWTSSHNDSAARDILASVAGLKGLGDDCNKNIYLVDGARIDFILRVVAHAKREQGAVISFYYPDTGLVNKADERHGSFLPLELVVADVLPIKVDVNGEERLYVYVNQPFDRSCYTRTIALALSFTGGWCREIKVGFPDYNAAQHETDAAAAKLPFEGRLKKISPFSFVPSNLNALEAE